MGNPYQDRARAGNLPPQPSTLSWATSLYMYTYTYAYIYIYIQREREKETCMEICNMHACIHTYMLTSAFWITCLALMHRDTKLCQSSDRRPFAPRLPKTTAEPASLSRSIIDRRALETHNLHRRVEAPAAVPARRAHSLASHIPVGTCFNESRWVHGLQLRRCRTLCSKVLSWCVWLRV